jgi:anti-anti-sigma factor
MPTTPFNVKISPLHDGVCVVCLAGEFDISTSSELADQLVVAPGARVVVDLAELGFMDSSGLTALIIASKRLGLTGGELVLTRPAPNIRRLLEMVGLEDWVREWESGWSAY